MGKRWEKAKEDVRMERDWKKNKRLKGVGRAKRKKKEELAEWEKIDRVGRFRQKEGQKRKDWNGEEKKRNICFAKRRDLEKERREGEREQERKRKREID